MILGQTEATCRDAVMLKSNLIRAAGTIPEEYKSKLAAAEALCPPCERLKYLNAVIAAADKSGAGDPAERSWLKAEIASLTKSCSASNGLSWPWVIGIGAVVIGGALLLRKRW